MASGYPVAAIGRGKPECTLPKSSLSLARHSAPFCSGAGADLKRKKYENPISKDTLQPDKVLFDRAINDIEHGRYEVARLTLNTLINTYDSSEYLAKAKLAIADSWYREGGPHGLAQAEAEYKDFELFYPNMEESAESQWRVCQIHYKQMEKVDRDNTQALRAEDECTQMVTAYPNSRYTKQATQMLRNVQEVLAAKEFRTGAFYYNKGAFPAAESAAFFRSPAVPAVQRRRRRVVDGGGFVQAHGRPVRESAGGGAIENRAELSAERSRGRSQGTAHRDEEAHSSGRSGGLRADEIRPGKYA